MATYTLKEFSEQFAPLPYADPEWRKTFPPLLQYEEIIIRKGGLWLWEKTKWELQEQWECVHAGAIIDTEWRAVPKQYAERDSLYGHML